MSLASRIAHLPLTIQQKLLRLHVQEQYKQSLFLTGTKLLGYNFTDYTHGDIIRSLTDDSNKRKLIVCPRGSFKSTLACVAYPIWRILKDPNIRILIDSELYTNSKNFLREIKAQLQSERVAELFGEFRTRENWSEDSITIRQRNIPHKESTITCAGIGSEKTGQHYDVIIMDDLNSPSNSLTIEARKKVIDHYKMMSAILEPNGTIVVIGTRYAADDVIGHIMTNEIAVGEGLL